MIVDHSHGRLKPKLKRSSRNRQRILRMRNPSAQHRIDVDVEVAMRSLSNSSFLSSTFKLFFETSSGIHVVDGDLQMLQSRPVQPLDPILRQQVAVW